MCHEFARIAHPESGIDYTMCYEILRRLAAKLVAWLITSNTQSVTSVLHQSIHPQTSVRESQVWS